MIDAESLATDVIMLTRQLTEQSEQAHRALIACALGFDRIEELIFESGESSGLINEIYAVSRQTCEAVDKLIPTKT